MNALNEDLNLFLVSFKVGMGSHNVINENVNIPCSRSYRPLRSPWCCRWLFQVSIVINLSWEFQVKTQLDQEPDKELLQATGGTHQAVRQP